MRYLIVFVSGMCALVYQVVWMRLFIHVFGQSVYSTTTVVCAFMAGLGIGSYLAPYLLKKIGRGAWRLYAIVELGIAITAASLPLAISPITSIYIMSATQNWGVSVTFVKFLLSFLALVVPTTLMGLTLPVVVQACADEDLKKGREDRGNTRRIGYLYGFNTAGAAIGCFLVGFVLVMSFGVRATIVAMAALNCLISLTVYFVFVRGERPTNVSGGQLDAKTAAEGAEPKNARRRRLIVLVLYGLIGVASFGYEMCWFRTLVFFIQSATYSFSILLTTYLIGLALGSLFFSRWMEPRIDRSAQPMVTTAIAGATGQMLLAIIGASTLYLCKEILPLFWQALIRVIGAESVFAISVEKFIVAGFIILPPTFIMGAMFPAMVKLYRGSTEGEAETVGYLYASNTAGAVLGTLVTGFVLFNLIGLQNTLVALSALSMCTGIGLLVASKGALRKRYALPAVVVLAVVFGSSVFFIPQNLFKNIVEQYRGVKVIFHRESASDTVVVGEHKYSFAGSPVRELIYHDGRGTCLSGLNTNQMHRLSAYSAMVEVPRAEDILVISFGCGNTASAFTSFPIRSLDIVDLSSNVYETAKYFRTNFGVLDDPRVTTFVDDGRNYLMTTDRRYDVIELELPSLHTEGVVSLFTKEFYELVRKRLKPGGIVHQWIDVYQAEREIGYMLINTMRQVFPHSTRVWDQRAIFEPDLSVGGGMWWGVAQNSAEDVPIEYSDVKALFDNPQVRKDLGFFRQTLPGVMGRLVASPSLVKKMVANARIITDDDTYVDFTIPNKRNRYAFGGGLGYYNAPLARVIFAAWEKAGVFKNKRKDYWAFYPKENYLDLARTALHETYRGVPPAVMKEIVERQQYDMIRLIEEQR